MNIEASRPSEDRIWTHVTASGRYPVESHLAPGVRGHDEGCVRRALAAHEVHVVRTHDWVGVVDQTNGTVRCIANKLT